MKNHKLHNAGIVAVLFLALMLPAFSVSATDSYGGGVDRYNTGSSLPQTAADPIKIVTSITILADFVENIAGDRAEVYSLADGNEDPHTYEPTSEELIQLQEADLVILMNIPGIEPYWDGAFQTNVLDDNPNLDILKVVKAEWIQLDSTWGRDNPHVWTSPVIAKDMVDVIYDKLAESKYGITAEGRDAYQLQLDAVISEVATARTEWEGVKLVAHHPAMMYLYDLLGLNRVAILENVPGAEPTAQHIQEVTKTMQEQEIKLISHQANLDDESIREIAENTGAKAIITIPLLGMTGYDGEVVDTYLELIRYNIDALDNPVDPNATDDVDIAGFNLPIIGFSLVAGIGLIAGMLRRRSLR